MISRTKCNICELNRERNPGFLSCHICRTAVQFIVVEEKHKYRLNGQCGLSKAINNQTPRNIAAA